LVVVHHEQRRAMFFGEFFEQRLGDHFYFILLDGE
jgi:hypothetical protein